MFFVLEMTFTTLFTVEFCMRLYAAEHVGEFFTNGFNLIDMVAIFPGYVELYVELVMSPARLARSPFRSSEA